METQVLEGTLSEIQRQLSSLPCAPDMRVRVTIEEVGSQSATQGTLSGISLASKPKADMAADVSVAEKPFRPTEFRNGVPLLPRRETAEPITTEFVNRLLDEEDEGRLRAGRTPGR